MKTENEPKLKFELFSCLKVYTVVYNGKEYFLYDDYNSNTDYNYTVIKDENGEEINDEIHDSIMEEYEKYQQMEEF